MSRQEPGRPMVGGSGSPGRRGQMLMGTAGKSKKMSRRRWISAPVGLDLPRIERRASHNVRQQPVSARRRQSRMSLYLTKGIAKAKS